MKFKVGYVYLKKQFVSPDRLYKAAKKVVLEGDFTLGKALSEFEKNFAKKFSVKHAIGVGSGTDALYLPLKALGIKEGDEVITASNSFVASAAVIALTGARPVFVDVRDDYTIDPALLEKAITPRTKGIIPVHLAGFPADMYPILKLAKKYHLQVIEDAAQGAGIEYDGKYIGSFGIATGFSMHPLKILNIWGDGGIITTNDDTLADKLRLWRNHGLRSRDDVEFFAPNSRLDTFHAAVANEILKKDLDRAIAKRRRNAALYERELKDLEPSVHIPQSLCAVDVKPIYTNYVIQARDREKLIAHLTSKRIEVVVQYPTPIHLKRAAKYLGYKKGDFPVTESQADTILTIPNNQYLTTENIIYVCNTIKNFYRKVQTN